MSSKLTGFSSLSTNKMPEEILLNIFSYIPNPNLCRYARVCKDWQACINSEEFLLSQLQLRAGREFSSNSEILKYLSYFSANRSILLNKTIRTLPDDLARQIERGIQLRPTPHPNPPLVEIIEPELIPALTPLPNALRRIDAIFNIAVCVGIIGFALKYFTYLTSAIAYSSPVSVSSAIISNTITQKIQDLANRFIVCIIYGSSLVAIGTVTSIAVINGMSLIRRIASRIF